MGKVATTDKQELVAAPVARVIKKLMVACKVKEAHLARATGLPQATVNRLLLGGTVDPRASTLRPIAEFFGVSVGQLLGDELLNVNNVVARSSKFGKKAWVNVPVVDWQQALHWSELPEQLTILSHAQWVTSELALSSYAFALCSKAFMVPRFRDQSVLIVDPQAPYKDSSFVVVALDGEEVTVRQIMLDGLQVYLKHFDTTLPTINLKEAHAIVGTIVESRVKLYKFSD